MIPEGYTEYTKGADIHISKDGKFLYASNRGHNSIVIFKVNEENGSLNLVGFEPVKGGNPRNFSLSPDNKFLLVANRDTNNIVSFQRDEFTGKLTFVDEVTAPDPVCILF
jgi:6-phosphogluconolactonase